MKLENVKYIKVLFNTYFKDEKGQHPTLQGDKSKYQTFRTVPLKDLKKDSLESQVMKEVISMWESMSNLPITSDEVEKRYIKVYSADSDIAEEFLESLFWKSKTTEKIPGLEGDFTRHHSVTARFLSDRDSLDAHGSSIVNLVDMANLVEYLVE